MNNQVKLKLRGHTQRYYYLLLSSSAFLLHFYLNLKEDKHVRQFFFSVAELLSLQESRLSRPEYTPAFLLDYRLLGRSIGWVSEIGNAHEKTLEFLEC